MDVRGIEVTNQLRSAIRAKLLELGVRYDEELPDYILVMVVNKKSRQQMHDDLHLFLEGCTTPFVDWLHDQVLRKLQKVTVAKKKSLREFVPTVVVKQEEERKKKKEATTSFLEDQAVEQTGDKIAQKAVKEDKPINKQNIKPSGSSQKSEVNQSKNTEKGIKSNISCTKSDDVSTDGTEQEATSKNNEEDKRITVKEVLLEDEHNRLSRIQNSIKDNDSSTKGTKRLIDTKEEQYKNITKRGKVEESKTEEEENRSNDSLRKLKSCVNKPKITSVVSVKNRLGIASPRKKFEVYRDKSENDGRHRQLENRFEKHTYDNNHRNGKIQRNRNIQDEHLRRKHELEIRRSETEKSNDIKSRLGNVKDDRISKSIDARDKINLNAKAKLSDKNIATVKDRLGIIPAKKEISNSIQDSTNLGYPKSLEQDKESTTNTKRIKQRLGAVKYSQSSEDDDYLNLGSEEELEDEMQTAANTAAIKSHIIAVNKPYAMGTERKRRRMIDKDNKETDSDTEETNEDTRIPSKVIVTPRPLKPLQPIQRRATKSLLLRAVAEANQSVVTQKNPEPSLLEKKPILKRLKPSNIRDVRQNLSVHLNTSKRLVMEKIQVELNTTDGPETEPKPYIPETVNDEHIGVVMSLFQRSDDKQKFLVTLSGYNNNHAKEKVASDDDERLEMQVNEDDELALSTTQNDSYATSDTEQNALRITDTENDTDTSTKERSEENNENCNIENVEIAEGIPKKRRRLSPIVYNRSESQSPELKSIATRVNLVTKRVDKKPLTENSVMPVTDKSRERCRYWPNCTLGSKCAYLHPSVMCSAFPACKFGDKCAYRHPKCKFGLSCTKLGCVFSHPSQQCKYHPFCTKPGCPYSHPSTQTTTVGESTSQRAKFTWRRRD